jgi:hypothetical protein
MIAKILPGKLCVSHASAVFGAASSRFGLVSATKR